MEITLEEAQEILKYYEPSIVYPPEIEDELAEAARMVDAEKSGANAD